MQGRIDKLEFIKIKNLLCQKECWEQEDKSQTWRKYLQSNIL